VRFNPNQTEAKSHSAFGIIHLPLNQTHCNIDVAAQQQQQMLLFK
jgi:hypothetical protein